MHDPFAELVDRARADDAARERSRERWLRHQAEEGATLVGTLVDLAELTVPVTVTTASHRRHHGVVTTVATDFVVLHRAAGDVFLRLATMVMVQPRPSRNVPPLRPTASDDRAAPLDLRLAELLVGAAPHRPRISVATVGNDAVVCGELRSAGVDVATLALDGEPGLRCYVSVPSLSEVSVLASG